MRKFLTVLLISIFSVFSIQAECTEKTKAQVDALKAAIPYPKYNIGDVLYIAFINAPNVETNRVTERDIDVYCVRIEDMRLINGIGGPDLINGLYLGFQNSRGDFPIVWEYQYVDNSIKEPRNRDLSDFYQEKRFFTTPYEAKKSLLRKNKH